jgi:hypothetical protein
MFSFKRGICRTVLAASAVMAGTPVFAQAPADPPFTLVPPEQRLQLGDVFAHASPLMQLVMGGLALAAVAAVLVWAVNLFDLTRGQPRRGLLGGVAFLSALGAAGPLLGGFGAAYVLLHGFLGVANVRPTPTLTIMAPGFAEALASIALGLLAAAVGVIGHRHLQARIKGLELHAEDAARGAAPSLSQTARMLG